MDQKTKDEIAAGNCVVVPVTVPDHMIESLLFDSEAATHYWCQYSGKQPTYWQMKMLGEKLHLYTYEDTGNRELEASLKDEWKPSGEHLPEAKDAPKRHFLVVTAEKIKTGLRLMAEKYPHHFVSIMQKDTDSTTADVLIQMAVFGEIVYG